METISHALTKNYVSASDSNLQENFNNLEPGMARGAGCKLISKLLTPSVVTGIKYCAKSHRIFSRDGFFSHFIFLFCQEEEEQTKSLEDLEFQKLEREINQGEKEEKESQSQELLQEIAEYQRLTLTRKVREVKYQECS